MAESQVFNSRVTMEVMDDSKEIQTIPYDPRFPNSNQTRNCYQHYLDYHRCMKKRGKDCKDCSYFKTVYLTLCPKIWYEKWDDEIKEGIFPGRI